MRGTRSGGSSSASECKEGEGLIEPISGTEAPGTGRAKMIGPREAEIASILAEVHSLTRAPLRRLWTIAAMLRGYVNDDALPDGGPNDDITRQLAVACEETGQVWLAVMPMDGSRDSVVLAFSEGGEAPTPAEFPISTRTGIWVDLTAAFGQLSDPIHIDVYDVDALSPEWVLPMIHNIQ
jgi:hypothetical protein